MTNLPPDISRLTQSITSVVDEVVRDQMVQLQKELRSAQAAWSQEILDSLRNAQAIHRQEVLDLLRSAPAQLGLVPPSPTSPSN